MAMDEHFFGARATAIVNIVIFDATNHEHTVGKRTTEFAFTT